MLEYFENSLIFDCVSTMKRCLTEIAVIAHTSHDLLDPLGNYRWITVLSFLTSRSMHVFVTVLSSMRYKNMYLYIHIWKK